MENELKNKNQFCGIATMNFFASDLEKAKEWYSDLFRIDPYFVVPGYIEFQLGDDSVELGIIDSKYESGASSEIHSGAVVYWQVSNLDEAAERIKNLGGKVHRPVVERGNGLITASFIDPFGNILGIMHNPHYMEIRGKRNYNG